MMMMIMIMIIMTVSGLGTSSMYCDELLQSRGFPFECYDDKQKTIVVKSHDPGHLPYFDKIILIIRNPFDAFLSYANLASVGHTGYAPLHILKEGRTQVSHTTSSSARQSTSRTVDFCKIKTNRLLCNFLLQTNDC